MGIPPKPLGLLVCLDPWQTCNATTTGLVPKLQIRYGNGLQNYSECPSPPQPTLANLPELRNPNYNHLKINYDFGQIQVYLNDSLRLSGKCNINFAGYFGVSAATGSRTDVHSIKNFVLYTQKPLLVPLNAVPDRILCQEADTQLGVVETDSNYSYT
jgi:hypothetical protein